MKNSVKTVSKPLSDKGFLLLREKYYFTLVFWQVYRIIKHMVLLVGNLFW